MRVRPISRRLLEATVLLALGLALASCSQGLKAPAPQAAAPRIAAPAKRAPPAVDPEILSDQAAVEAAQRSLNQLGYEAGKPDGIAGPSTRRSILAFEKDHALAEDGRLTAAIAESLRTMAEAPSVTVEAGDVLVFSDGSSDVATAERSLAWDQPDGGRNLVAIRPGTVTWPAAARAGLDWATTHALDLPASSPPVEWSSSGVGQHFAIRTFPSLSDRETALVGGPGQPCRRFEMRTDDSQRRYPGLACKDAKGAWSIARSHIRIARPATGLGARTAAESVRPPAN